MLVVYSLLIAALIVIGQMLWKVAVTTLERAGGSVFSFGGMTRLLTSPALIAGMIVYGLATFGYIFLIGRYKYIQVQPLVVGGSLVFTFIIATLLFKEQYTLLTLVGFGLILLGAVLIIR